METPGSLFFQVFCQPKKIIRHFLFSLNIFQIPDFKKSLPACPILITVIQ